MTVDKTIRHLVTRHENIIPMKKTLTILICSLISDQCSPVRQYTWKGIRILSVIVTVVAFSHFISAQEIIKNDFIVNDDTFLGDHHFPMVTMNKSGNFIIAWNDERHGWDDWDIFFQSYDLNGNSLGSNIRVNDDGAGLPQVDVSVAMNDAGNFVLAWEDERPGYRCIFYQVYNSNGNPVGANNRANDANAVGLDPAVAMDDAGNFVITWKDHRNSGDRDIYFQMFDADGNKIGMNVKANDDVGSAHQESPSIAMNDDGDFVISWDDFRDGSARHVYLQRYDPYGNPLDSNIRVDDDPGNSITTSIAMDENGNFVVVWSDERSGADIYFQMYDNNGNTNGSNVKVSDDIGNIYHSFPNVAMEINGDFVITWRSYTTLENDDVEGQRYSANGEPIGGNLMIVADGPNHIESVPWVAANSSRIAFTWTDNRRVNGSFDTYGKVVTWNWEGISGIGEMERRLVFDVFPNPAEDVVNCQLSTVNCQFYRVELYDIYGKLLRVLFEGKASNQEMTFDVSNLAPGMYFVRVQAGERVGVRKLIIQ